MFITIIDLFTAYVTVHNHYMHVTDVYNCPRFILQCMRRFRTVTCMFCMLITVIDPFYSACDRHMHVTDVYNCPRFILQCTWRFRTVTCIRPAPTTNSNSTSTPSANLPRLTLYDHLSHQTLATFERLLLFSLSHEASPHVRHRLRPFKSRYGTWSTMACPPSTSFQYDTNSRTVVADPGRRCSVERECFQGVLWLSESGDGSTDRCGAGERNTGSV